MSNLFDNLPTDILTILFKLVKNDYKNLIKALPRNKIIKNVYLHNIDLVKRGLINPDEWFTSSNKTELEDIDFHQFLEYNENGISKCNSEISHSIIDDNPILNMYCYDTRNDWQGTYNLVYKIKYVKSNTKIININLITNHEYYVQRSYSWDSVSSSATTTLSPVSKGWLYFWNYILDSYERQDLLYKNNLYYTYFYRLEPNSN